MKIGILTLPLHTNYGGILQAWALQTVLERMGHEVKVITEPLDGKKVCFRSKIIGILKVLIHKIKKKPGNNQIIWWKNRSKKILTIRQHTNKFIETYIKARYTNRLSEIKKSEFDCFVVGSDQIWRRNYPFWDTIENAYLDFAKTWNIKRIAYAPSFGKDDINEYSYNEIKNCKKLLQLFDKVSVREESGINICKDYFEVDAVHVLDPTLLLEFNDYLSLIPDNKKKIGNGKIFNYILDRNSDIDKILNAICNCSTKDTFCVNGRCDYATESIEKKIQGPLEDWLAAFYSADSIITDSFHACVFSIIFDKPFLVYANMHRGTSRIESLLKILNLEQRIISNLEDFNSKIKLLDINPAVGLKIKDLRIQSMLFLQNCL